MKSSSGTMPSISAHRFSRRSFLAAAAAAQRVRHSPRLCAAGCPGEEARQSPGRKGMFAWQFPSADNEATWRNQSFSIDRWWGDFSHDLPDQMICSPTIPGHRPFTKHMNNPVLARLRSLGPGTFLRRRAQRIHRRERRRLLLHLSWRESDRYPAEQPIDYICDIGVASSKDGVHFAKDNRHSPFFRKGEDRRFSYEDVNVVRRGIPFTCFAISGYGKSKATPA